MHFVTCLCVALLHECHTLRSSLVVQLEQQSGVDQMYPDEAYEPAPFVWAPGQLRRLKNEQDRFLGAGGVGQVSW